MDHLSHSRRRFLRALGGSALALPSLALPGFVQLAGAQPGPGHTLILVELAGGNDGLNTLIPLRDLAYRGLRPEIGITASETLALDAELGFHPAMRDMAELWQAGELQVIEGVGYPNPNRSHFRSIEIWNTGGGAEHFARSGWVSRAFAASPMPVAGAEADGLILGGPAGPLAGPGRFSALRDEASFLEALEMLPDGAGSSAADMGAEMAHPVRPQAASPLEHVLQTYEAAQLMGSRIEARLEATRRRRFTFPETALGAQLEVAARLLAAGAEVPVMKVMQQGYDTHQAQPEEHAELLRDLSEAVAAFAEAMRQVGRWQEVTLVTYSEFGRTARENASAGTDHGTAAPVLVAGGAVRGGLSGARPDLSRLVDDDLVHTTDYRALYRAILRDLWQIDFAPDAGWRQSELALL